MGNMNYCRFQNTLIDLRECEQDFDDELSEDEYMARYKLLKLCNSIVDSFDLEDYKPNNRPSD